MVWGYCFIPVFFLSNTSSSGRWVDTRVLVLPEKHTTPTVMVQASALNTQESLPTGVGEPEHQNVVDVKSRGVDAEE